MELIKIDTDHFVVVNKTIQPVNGYYYDSFINKIKSTNGAEYGEASHCWQITHSTQPLEKVEWGWGKLGYIKIQELSLQEIKELLGVVDVEKKAHNWSTRQTTRSTDYWRSMVSTYVEAYNQALEDNKAKKYTEEDLKYMFDCGRNYQNNAEITFKASFEYLLQTKTSWQVEIVDGKLKLKGV